MNYEVLCTQLCSWLEQQSSKLHVDKGLRLLSLDGKAPRGASKAHGSELHVLTLIESITGVLKRQIFEDD